MFTPTGDASRSSLLLAPQWLRPTLRNGAGPIATVSPRRRLPSMLHSRCSGPVRTSTAGSAMDFAPHLDVGRWGNLCRYRHLVPGRVKPDWHWRGRRNQRAVPAGHRAKRKKLPCQQSACGTGASVTATPLPLPAADCVAATFFPLAGYDLFTQANSASPQWRLQWATRIVGSAAWCADQPTCPWLFQSGTQCGFSVQLAPPGVATPRNPPGRNHRTRHQAVLKQMPRTPRIRRRRRAENAECVADKIGRPRCQVSHAGECRSDDMLRYSAPRPLCEQ